MTPHRPYSIKIFLPNGDPAWVREHDRDGVWAEWGGYVGQRYGYSEDLARERVVT